MAHARPGRIPYLSSPFVIDRAARLQLHFPRFSRPRPTSWEKRANVNKTGENARERESANQDVLLYDKLSTKSGPIAQTLDRAAQSIADGENGNDVKQRVSAGLK
jgi:hypothetical protein